MMVRRSVRLRTTIAASAVIALGVVAAGVTLEVLLHRSLLMHVDDVADTEIADVAALARSGKLPSTLAGAGDDGSVVHVVDDHGRVVARSAGSSRSIPTLRAAGNEVRSGTTGGRRVNVRRLTIPSGARTIYVSTSLEPVDEALSRLRHVLLLVGPGLLLFSGLTTWLVLGRALQPVEDIRARVARITAGSLDERVPVPDSNDEIGRLARTMNEMLDRIEAGVDHQRRFVGDASHELRTPLASLRADVEVALEHPASTDWTVTGTEVLRTALGMERLVHDLLYLARLDAGERRATPLVPVDLDDVVLEEAAAVRARAQTVVDTSRVSGASVRGRRDDLARVVRNLLDNAERHATEQVTVSLRADPDVATLVVTDDGPGIPTADRRRVFERFTRLDDSRTRATGGSGLGLAIAKEIMEAHGGTIEVDDVGVVVRIPCT